jgi:glutamyl-Q tRNA(Asp) synthetase
MVPTFRFAPSPNGLLHLGHALSALINFERARAAGGRFLLRIEDIDVSRCRPDYEQAIYEDLSWLGIAWEEPVRRQSDHLADYAAALERLDARGLVYASFESRGEIARMVEMREAEGPWPRDPDGSPLYPGSPSSVPPHERAERMAAGEPYALRLDVEAAMAAAGPLAWHEYGTSASGHGEWRAAEPQAWGDVVLARKDIPTSYHLSVVVDDALQGVTEVVRGQDLFAATSVHRLLQTLLGLPSPAYRHHHLMLDGDGRKLSKSTRATALRSLRAEGATVADIRRLIGPL